MLQDPIAGKGNANILPALKVPEFGEIPQMESANNQLALNAAKLAADQKAKADALAAAKVKAEKEAQDAAKKAEAKQQADAWTLLKPEDSPLIGDAPKWAAEAYDKMVKEAQGLMAQGVDLNSFDPKAVAFRSGTLQNYHVNYKRHSEVAKALAEKQKKWNENPDGFEPFSLADELGSKYNVTGWDKDYYTPSLLPKVGVATPAEIAAYEKQMFGESKYKKDMSGKPVGRTRDGDDVYLKTESYESRPFEQTAEDVNKNLRYSTDTKQKQLYNFYHNQAKAQGLVDENDNILPQYFQKREEVTREKGGIEDVVQQVQRERGGEGGEYNRVSASNGVLSFQYGKNKFVDLVAKDDIITMPIKYDKAYKGKKGDVIKENGQFPVVGVMKYPNQNPLVLSSLFQNSIWTSDKDNNIVSIPSKQIETTTASMQNLMVMPSNGKRPLTKRELAAIPEDQRRYQVFIQAEDDKYKNPLFINVSTGAPQMLNDYNIYNTLDESAVKAMRGQSQATEQQTPQNKTAPKTPPAMEMDFKGF